MRFAWKVFLGAVVVVVITTVLVERLAVGKLETQRLAQIDDQLRENAYDLAILVRAGLLAGDSESLHDLARSVGQRGDRRITVLDAGGDVLADSSGRPSEMENHALRPEVRMPGLVAERRSASVGEVLRYTAEPVRDEAGQLVGYARVAMPVAGIEDDLASLRSATRTAALVALVVGLLLSVILADRVSRPLAQASQVLQALGRGEFGERMPPGGRDEIGRLSTTVNEIAGKLERRQASLDREVGQKEAILAAMEEGLLAVDDDDRVVLVNPAALQLFADERRGELVGRELAEVTVATDLVDAAREVRATGQRVEAELDLGAAGESPLIVEFTALPADIARDAARVVVFVLRDLTEIRRLEKVRTDFVANVSHELKTPLTSMRGYVEAVLDDPDMPVEQRARFLGKAIINTQRLVDIVTDLLDLARMESPDHELLLTRLELGGLAAECVARAAGDAEPRGVQVRLRPAGQWLSVRGDRRALAIALDNLLSNAVKYSPPSGTVEVSLGRDDERVWVDVADRGPGIEPDEQQRIFERFYRVDKNRSRALGGTGLGLSIVRNVALAHGGTVQLDSALGEGSRFRLVLPADGSAFGGEDEVDDEARPGGEVMAG